MTQVDLDALACTNDDLDALALIFVAPLLVLIALAARTLAAGAHSGELVVA